METDAPARTRARAWLLILLGVAVVAFVAMQMRPFRSATPPPAASNNRTPVKGAARNRLQAPIDPSDLDVRLGELKGARPGPGETARNPFRFAPPPAPPAPPPRPGGGTGREGTPAVPPGPPPPPPGPPPPPPIPLKFFGIVEKTGQGKIAALSDCRSTYYGREGDVVAGQYRLVKIGIESVIMEYPDGRGRTTIRLSGQECVGK